MKLQLFNKIKLRFLRSLGLLIFIGFSTFGFAQKSEFVVVLDAGHGGKDPGKVAHNSIKEKEIALNIVLLVGEMLEKEKGIKVIYTRKTDVFVDLWERGRIANKADADLFVSIHCNAHNSQAEGAESWVLGTHANARNFEVAKAENSVILMEDNYHVNYKGFDPSSPASVIGLTLMQEEYLDQSIQIASLIQDDFTNGLKRKNREVKQAGFVVLHQTYMPSVLIETGFITNNEEGAYLNSSKGQSDFAKSIFKSILKYVNQLNLNTVDSNNSISLSTSASSTENSNNTSVLNGVAFKVQIATGSSKIETKSYNFKGLTNVERIKEGNKYKYYYGESSNYNEIKKMQDEAISKGYKTAFIVAYKNGEKIDVSEALKGS